MYQKIVALFAALLLAGCGVNARDTYQTHSVPTHSRTRSVQVQSRPLSVRRSVPRMRRRSVQRSVAQTDPRSSVAIPRGTPSPTRHQIPTQHRTYIPRRTSSPTSEWGFGCADALRYLALHAAPLFHIHICPGWADGGQAMTCALMPGICPGVFEIVINDPCPAAYMNEAYNSQLSAKAGRIVAPDIYGHC